MSEIETKGMVYLIHSTLRQDTAGDSALRGANIQNINKGNQTLTVYDTRSCVLSSDWLISCPDNWLSSTSEWLSVLLFLRGGSSNACRYTLVVAVVTSTRCSLGLPCKTRKYNYEYAAHACSTYSI